MKIAILAPFYPYRVGLAQFNAKLYIELQKDSDVCAYTFTSLYPNFLFPGKTQFVEEGDDALVVKSVRVLNSVNPFSYIKTAQMINRFCPDIVFIPYWMSFLAPAFGAVCLFLKKNIKVVSLVHNAISHEKMIMERPLAKFFFNRCDGFVVMSKPVMNDLRSLRGNAPVILQPHPIFDQFAECIDRIKACEELKISSDKKTLLFFGLIREYKGLDLLIEAMDNLDDSYQLIIAGECYGDFGKYAQLIEKSKLKNNIIVYEQYIPDSMVSLLFSAADVLVLPYRSATQSGVVALAYQLEMPMISTNVGALGSTIAESGTGIVVDDVSSEDIAKGIKEFFACDRLSYYKENLKREKERLSWPNFVKGLLTFFDSLLSCSRPVLFIIFVVIRIIIN